jgi:hypothetical protein
VICLDDGREWIANNPNATAKEIYQQLGKMMDKFNLNNRQIHEYRAAETPIRRRHIEQLRTAVNAVRTCAGLSTVGFTDVDLTLPAAKQMQEYHINELRAVLDAARAQLALPAITYTNHPTVTAGTRIVGAHIMELRGGVK